MLSPTEILDEGSSDEESGDESGSESSSEEEQEGELRVHLCKIELIIG